VESLARLSLADQATLSPLESLLVNARRLTAPLSERVPWQLRDDRKTGATSISRLFENRASLRAVGDSLETPKGESLTRESLERDGWLGGRDSPTIATRRGETCRAEGELRCEGIGLPPKKRGHRPRFWLGVRDGIRNYLITAACGSLFATRSQSAASGTWG
jgi:hypothetical protein